ncbi:hypothetical protein BT93_G1435 [Corymbia citriodora subsp. variegata]|nr:hypothetical protein BT93_G1435 [Corymbia citriodora subsp. variegata]
MKLLAPTLLLCSLLLSFALLEPSSAMSPFCGNKCKGRCAKAGVMDRCSSTATSAARSAGASPPGPTATSTSAHATATSAAPRASLNVLDHHMHSPLNLETLKFELELMALMINKRL